METRTCKICFDDEKQEEIISPCNCKGSMAYVHKSCLKEWLNVNKENDKYFTCSECKSPYKRETSEACDRRAKNMANLINVGNIFCTSAFSMMLIYNADQSFIFFVAIFLAIMFSITVWNLHDYLNSYWFILLIFVMAFTTGKVRFLTLSALTLIYYVSACIYYTNHEYEKVTTYCRATAYQSFKPKIFDKITCKYVDGVI